MKLIRVLLVVVGWAITAQTVDAAPKNVVLLVVDDLGFELGCYGDAAARTPNLDRIAADGTRFTHAFCTTASCSASRSVILSGLHNHANGQYGHQHAEHHFSSFDRVKSLSTRLSDAGYRTARIGKYHVAPESVHAFDVALPGNAPTACKWPTTAGSSSRPTTRGLSSCIFARPIRIAVLATALGRWGRTCLATKASTLE